MSAPMGCCFLGIGAILADRRACPEGAVFRKTTVCVVSSIVCGNTLTLSLVTHLSVPYNWSIISMYQPKVAQMGFMGFLPDGSMERRPGHADRLCPRFDI